MNGIQFRRQLVAAAIAEGLDLGAAVAAAQEADAWCQAADGAEPVPRLALPAPKHFARESRDERESLEAAVPVNRGRPRKQNGRRLETVPGAARQPRRGERNGVRGPAGAAPSSSRKSVASKAQESRHAAKRVVRHALLMRALAGAGAAGLSGKAARTTIGCSEPTCGALLKAAVAAGEVERVGPKAGMHVRWRLVAGVAARAKSASLGRSEASPVSAAEGRATKSGGAGAGKPRRSSAGTASAGADPSPRAAPPEPVVNSVPTREDKARRSNAAEGVSARDPHTRSDPEGGSENVRGLEPARESATKPAGGSIPPAGSSLARLPKVEQDVLAALARAPDEGLDLPALVAKTEYPGASVQTALTALRAARAIHSPRPGKFALAGVA